MISVIIPVYNTEKYLSKCIDSVLGSLYQDFEIILINDGSTDNSLRVCKHYCRRDNRVKLIEQENQGASVARNRGIAVSSGEWLVFVDSDDMISCDFLNIVAKEQAGLVDLLIFNFAKSVKEFEGIIEEPERHITLYEEKDKLHIIGKMLEHGQLMEGYYTNLCSPCGKAYRRSFLERYSIEFPVGIDMGEDILFNARCFANAKKYKYIPKTVYLYFVRIDSVTHSYISGLLQNYIRYQRELKGILEGSGVLPALESAYYANALENMAYILIKGIFSPYTTKSYQENCRLCEKMQNDEIYKCALYYNHKTGIFPRRVLLFFFRIKWYRAVKMLCMLCNMGITWIDARKRKELG